jgi:predicted RNase H-like nuclease (RuvC/YqgF family)
MINANVTLTLRELDELRNKLDNTTHELEELKKNIKYVEVRIKGEVTDTSQVETISNPYHYTNPPSYFPNAPSYVSRYMSVHPKIKIDSITTHNLDDVIETLRTSEQQKVESKITALTKELQVKDDTYNKLLRDTDKELSSTIELKDKIISELNAKIDKLKGKEVTLTLEQKIDKLEALHKEDAIHIKQLTDKLTKIKHKTLWQRLINTND